MEGDNFTARCNLKAKDKTGYVGEDQVNGEEEDGIYYAHRTEILQDRKISRTRFSFYEYTNTKHVTVNSGKKIH